jgi:nucleoside-diphosphate-sugar epimerase
VRDGQIVLRSHPDTPRDFIWLGDVARSMHILLQRPDLAGSLFNLSSGQSTSIGTVARLVAALAAKHLGRSVPLYFENACTAPPAALRINNAAFTTATGQSFGDHMEEEIANLLTMASCV